jgi:3-phosphoshikimate 1-carboxyvinyltransferase
MDRIVIPTSSLQGIVNVPADKSISHRSALFAALAEGKSIIRNYSPAADPHSTLQCLKQLGVDIREDNGTVTVNGKGRYGLRTPDKPLDCGNSGTTMRLLSGIIGGANLKATLIGDESLSKRPMKRVIDPLRKMGCHIKAKDDNYAPLEFVPSENVHAISYPLPVASAQLKSCVLLSGLFGEKDTTVIETVASRNHTELLLHLPIQQLDGEIHIKSNNSISIPLQNYTIPGDFSAAAFWAVAGSIIKGSHIRIPNTGLNNTRTAAFQILKRMDGKLLVHNLHNEGYEKAGDLEIFSARLKAVNIVQDIVPNCIDEIPVLAVAMLFANGTSTIKGAKELRFKECDRLAAIADMFTKAGADFEELEDGFIIHGNPDFVPQGAIYETWKDHRIAMSAAILALKGNKKSTIRDADCTNISYPAFWADLTKLMD